MNHPLPSPQLQPLLTAPVASFARRRNYSYAPSQELTAGTRQQSFRTVTLEEDGSL